MLTQGETGLQLGDGKRNLVKKEGRSVEMANLGDPLADAIPRPLAQLRGRGKYQLLPARRSHHEAERAAHAEDPIVDENRRLLGQPLLEAGRIRSPRANLSSRAVPTPTAISPPPA